MLLLLLQAAVSEAGFFVESCSEVVKEPVGGELAKKVDGKTGGSIGERRGGCSADPFVQLQSSRGAGATYRYMHSRDAMKTLRMGR